jgi:hypothetical protein
MQYARVYAGPDGESHYEDVEVTFISRDYAPPAPPLGISSSCPATHSVFVHSPVGWYGDLHPTPVRQWWILLSGDAELQTSDGELRQFAPGAVVLLEDTTGKGHVSRILGDCEAFSVFIQLSEGTE